MTAKQISKALRDLADPTIAAHSQRFFKTGPGEYGEGDRFLGIRVPLIRQQVRKFHATPLDEIGKLLRSPFHEERLCALLLLVYQFDNADETKRAVIYRLYLNNTAYITNWDLVDSSAPHIVGAYLADNDRRVIHKLSRSKNRWDRRIAVTSTFDFIKLNQFDDSFALAMRLMRDKEDLIHKAIGWMLREIGKRDRNALKRFLDQHHNEMPRTMLRYAIERLPAAERRRY
ncbi:MAG: DNA alkylation repair protein, partial [Acidiferrobacterales bacterium]|nr:DNA alkylation repair protein [Acidiferrobacterales bacterium]